MNKKSYWDNFVPTETSESRFGMIPEGESVVEILDVQEILASQNFHLDNDGKIGPLEEKKVFDKAFDQNILALVYQDEEGRVLVDRRSSVGWLTADDKTATPDLISKYGLKPSGDRFLTRKGVGVPNFEKSKSCADIASRLFNAAGAATMADLIGLQLKIVAKKRGDNMDVVAYHSLEHETAEAFVPAKAGKAEPTEDDLPF